MQAPNAANEYLGAGEVLFNRLTSGGASTDGLRHFGLVDQFNLSVVPETLTKKNAMDGARGTYKEVVIGTEAEISMIMTEYDLENLALHGLGDAQAFSQSAGGPASGQTINGGVALKFDRWYFLGYYNVTVTAVKQGANTGVLGTDYVLNTELGLVKILSTSSLFTESVTTWDGSRAAITGKKKVRGLSVGKVEGWLKFFSASNQVSGPRVEADFWKCTLNPDGELPFISEEFGTFTLKGKVQKATTHPGLGTALPVGEEYYLIREL